MSRNWPLPSPDISPELRRALRAFKEQSVEAASSHGVATREGVSHAVEVVLGHDRFVLLAGQHRVIVVLGEREPARSVAKLYAEMGRVLPASVAFEVKVLRRHDRRMIGAAVRMGGDAAGLAALAEIEPG